MVLLSARLNTHFSLKSYNCLLHVDTYFEFFLCSLSPLYLIIFECKAYKNLQTLQALSLPADGLQ